MKKVAEFLKQYWFGIIYALIILGFLIGLTLAKFYSGIDVESWPYDYWSEGFCELRFGRKAVELGYC
ncbi:MAG: hypothetical protein ACOCRX_08505 [Candidatus Woesearchaeota archaeon]